jgi:hypothetical protein
MYLEKIAIDNDGFYGKTFGFGNLTYRISRIQNQFAMVHPHAFSSYHESVEIVIFFLVITLSFTEEIGMHSKHCDSTRIA